MLARMRGARSARGQVLVFLDAHCEAAADWLRPLLQRAKHKRDSVLTPLIDVVDQSTFKLEAAEEFQVGGFTFSGHFTWIDVPEWEKKRRGSDIAPTWSPTMAGGLFAINREYYWELGAYDEQMAGWGGENLEMSFRIWQCGGTLETIPCSRVGHVFRSFHPYGMPASSDTHGINTARMAEVWMDDYKELFYLHRPDLRKSPRIGDVTHRKVLREKLQCKSFEWYLQHVYKEKFVPVRDAFGYGRFRCLATGLCLDTLQREADGAPLGVYPCHNTLQGTQYLSLAVDGQLRDEERCVELQYTRQVGGEESGRRLLMVACAKNKHRQKWRYTANKQVMHVATGLCVDSGLEGGADVMAKPCRTNAPTQRWDIDYSEHNDFRLDGAEPDEAELTLQKLRGQRRISRSLLTYSDDSNNGTVRRHTHKKRRHKKNRKHGKGKRSGTKTKNKFLLKLVRTLMNNSEDHLEVDIHCKHKQLFPNNSFVRDLVTILNEKNIKVINNGRVFERNRVSELVKDPQTFRHKETKILEKLDVERPPAQPLPAPAPPQPPSQQAIQPPVQPSNRWLGKKRKVKVLRPQLQNALAASQIGVPVAPAPPPGSVSAINVAEQEVPYLDPPEQGGDKKIIIEDFVEVKQSSSTPEPYKQQRALVRQMKKHKKKNKLPKSEVSPRAEEEPGAADDTLKINPVMDEDMEPYVVEPAKPEPRKRLPETAVSSPPEYEEESMRLDPGMTQNSLEEVPALSAELPQEVAAMINKSGRSGAENAPVETSEVEGISDREREREKEIDRQREILMAKEVEQDSDRGDVYQADPNYQSDLNSQTAYSRRKMQQVSGAGDDLESDTDSPPISSTRDPPNNPILLYPRAHNASRPALRTKGAAKEPRGTPLKVVMKSNLTFNLGDEFFKWRSSDDAAEPGELSIPSNSSRPPPPLHAWLLPDPPSGRQRDPPSGRQRDPPATRQRTPLRARPRGRAPRRTAPPVQSASDDESSSSSESGDNDR